MVDDREGNEIEWRHYNATAWTTKSVLNTRKSTKSIMFYCILQNDVISCTIYAQEVHICALLVCNIWIESKRNITTWKWLVIQVVHSTTIRVTKCQKYFVTTQCDVLTYIPNIFGYVNLFVFLCMHLDSGCFKVFMWIREFCKLTRYHTN